MLLFVLGQDKSLVEAKRGCPAMKGYLLSRRHLYRKHARQGLGSTHHCGRRPSTHAHIHLHHCKTKVWNRDGVEPEGIAELTRRARQVRPDAVVWKGDPHLSLNQQDLRVLGFPIGPPEFVHDFLEAKSREHATLFQRIPWVPDTHDSLLAPPHMRINEGQLLVEDCQTRVDGGFRRTP